MKWDAEGVFKYKNKTIPGSNILHLVLHALIQINRKPPGMKEFYKGLKEVNVPEYLIKNNIGKLLISGREDEVQWRPPGDFKKKSQKK